MDYNWLILSILPISELRGGIPMGIASGIDLKILLPTCIVLNSLVYFPFATILKTGISRTKIADKYIQNVRRRGECHIRKYGFGGLLLFVGIPAPFTGVYTATILSTVFDMPYKRSYLAMLVGCCISAGIVTVIALKAVNI